MSVDATTTGQGGRYLDTSAAAVPLAVSTRMADGGIGGARARSASGVVSAAKTTAILDAEESTASTVGSGMVLPRVTQYLQGACEQVTTPLAACSFLPQAECRQDDGQQQRQVRQRCIAATTTAFLNNGDGTAPICGSGSVALRRPAPAA